MSEQTPVLTVVGQADEELNGRINEIKAEERTLASSLAMRAVQIHRAEAALKVLKDDHTASILKIEQLEVEARSILDKIGEAAGIEKGETWQLKPDGGVVRVELPAASEEAEEA